MNIPKREHPNREVIDFNTSFPKREKLQIYYSSHAGITGDQCVLKHDAKQRITLTNQSIKQHINTFSTANACLHTQNQKKFSSKRKTREKKI